MQTTLIFHGWWLCVKPFPNHLHLYSVENSVCHRVKSGSHLPVFYIPKTVGFLRNMCIYDMKLLTKKNMFALCLNLHHAYTRTSM